MSTLDHDTPLRITPPSERARASAAAEERAQSGMYFGLVILLSTIAFITLIVQVNSRAPTITLSRDSLVVVASGISARRAVSDIDSLVLLYHMPGMSVKRAGFQFGNTYHGVFDVRGYGRTNVQVNAVTPPFIAIRSAQGSVIFGAGDSTATRVLFDSLNTLRSSR